MIFCRRAPALHLACQGSVADSIARRSLTCGLLSDAGRDRSTGTLAVLSLLSGAVLTETIFGWPGLGRYATASAVSLDFPAVMGVTLVAAVVYPIVNTLVDIGYHALDSRLRGVRG